MVLREDEREKAIRTRRRIFYKIHLQYRVMDGLQGCSVQIDTPALKHQMSSSSIIIKSIDCPQLCCLSLLHTLLTRAGLSLLHPPHQGLSVTRHDANDKGAGDTNGGEGGIVAKWKRGVQ